jgi:D-amino-acid dehydrogenase
VSASRDVVVVGGGIIGVAIAHRLAADGADVELLERGAIGGGASDGNAGQLRVSECVPLAAPGVIGETLRFAVRRHAPVRVKPTAHPARVRWLLDFARATRRPLERRTRALADLGHVSAEAMRALVPELPASVRHVRGALDVFETPGGMQIADRDARLAAQHGFPCEVLDAREVRALEPALGDDIAGALHFPGDCSVDPRAFVAFLAERATAAGATLRARAEVRRLMTSADSVAVSTDDHVVVAKQVVLAGGTQTSALVEALGARLALLPGKGYSVDVAATGARLPARPAVLMERHAAVTPMGDRARLACGMVVGASDLRVPGRVVQRLLSDLQGPLPALRGARVIRRWAGSRPLTPDGVPLIGRLPGHPRIAVATGHAMLGVTFALGTAAMVSAIVAGRDAPTDLAPFDPGRFN